MIELPELPTPEYDYWGDFTPNQVQAYGRACAVAALEAAAKVCDEFDACDPKYIASSIRALKGTA
jgi:hypothetical protein